MKKISTHTFKHTLRDIHKHTESRKFCFILGAGASFKSGIPTGGQLAQEWYDEIKERYSRKEISEWVKEVRLDKKDLAAHYGSIYRKRFESDKTSGYEFLVQAMRKAKPTFGHIVLAQVLTKTLGHSVLTTNFDSLIETAIYQFTNKTPLVCGHESLSGYARPSEIHPLIVKIHRDLLLSPKSDPDEISKLDKGWKEPLDNIFSSHIPIVIGYGGNDGSLMSYFEKMNKPSNFFWCGLEKEPTSNRVKELIEHFEGNYVKIEGFDEVMHELLWVFDEIKPINEELDDITKNRIEAANKQLLEINKEIENDSTTDTGSIKELSAFEYANLADNESDYEKRKAIYLEALGKFPNTSWLWNKFTYFLHFHMNDYIDLEDYYLKALEVNPEDGNNNGNYAIFLNGIKKDYAKAETYYLKALEVDSGSVIKNVNYAIFLKEIKKDYTKAEIYYLKALEINSKNPILNRSYAVFLEYIKKDYKKAETHYLKALEIDPENNSNNGNYAVFLSTIKKNYNKAETYYAKALKIDSKHASNNGNYAQFLIITEKKEEAKKYLEKSFELNKNEKCDLLLELWFYKYAHFLEFIDEAKKKIEELLQEGIRSVGWNFSQNIEIAIKNGHPHPEKLKEFARRITEIPE